jgi:hypothetical protein
MPSALFFIPPIILWLLAQRALQVSWLARYPNNTQQRHSHPGTNDKLTS